MSIWVDFARVTTGLNVLLLIALGYVWGRNYLAVRTKHTLGLLFFSVALMIENALALYYYLVDPTLSVWFSTQVPVVAWRAMMLFHAFETIGLIFLTWITWD